jgi:hypothetical protein
MQSVQLGAGLIKRAGGVGEVQKRARGAIGHKLAYEHAQAWKGVTRFGKVEGVHGIGIGEGLAPRQRLSGRVSSCYVPRDGLAIISQKMATTAPKAGKPKANHHQNRRLY